jgi:hypothetical protein
MAQVRFCFAMATAVSPDGVEWSLPFLERLQVAEGVGALLQPCLIYVWVGFAAEQTDGITDDQMTTTAREL